MVAHVYLSESHDRLAVWVSKGLLCQFGAGRVGKYNSDEFR